MSFAGFLRAFTVLTGILSPEEGTLHATPPTLIWPWKPSLPASSCMHTLKGIFLDRKIWEMLTCIILFAPHDLMYYHNANYNT